MQDNDGKITAATPEERVAETAEDLAAITAGFENFEYQPDGAADPFTGEDLYRAVYANQGLGFITKQVAKFVGDWETSAPPRRRPDPLRPADGVAACHAEAGCP
ncbi:hypothetical protein QP175_05655 [Sphingomonas aerolata]|uniref:hypothetical protein n=1 Tax=Sphingomonas aerolata TaxID=185951 RepID=UPI002FE280E8